MADEKLAEVSGFARVCFFSGDSLPCLAVRADTRRPGQAFADVPSHCAVVLGTNAEDGWLYEFIAGGFHTRAAAPADFLWSVNVPLTDFAAAQTGAFAARESPYDWNAIAEIAAARIVPDRWLSLDTLKGHHICSCFAVYDVLLPGGWAAPGWLTRQFVPVSPNDVWWAVKGLQL